MSRYIEITRIFDAPRERVYRAFTDPDQLAQWLGRPGAGSRATASRPTCGPEGTCGSCSPGARLHSRVDLTFTEAVANALLAGEIEAAGVPGVARPVRAHLRVEFHDEGDGKTRVELRQGPFPAAQIGTDAHGGWDTSFTKLDALL